MERQSARRYLGQVCRKHPDLAGERHASNRTCVGCGRDAARRQYHADPKKNLATNAAATRRYRERNPEKRRGIARTWRQRNKGIVNAATARRHARIVGASVGLTDADRRRIVALYAEAAWRTAETGIVHHVDHDVPLAIGGTHHPGNLLVVPARMNRSKGARYASTWDYISS